MAAAEVYVSDETPKEEVPHDPDRIILPRAPAPEAPPADETPDYLFQLQLAITNFTAKNGRYMGMAAGTSLAGVLAWGLWNVWVERSAAAQFGAIAAIDYRMPKLCPAETHEDRGFCFSDADPRMVTGVAGDDPADAGRKADLEEGARRFEGAAKDAGGSAAVFGYLQAAEAWRRAGNKEAEVSALKAAYAEGGGDLPGWSAGSAYAAALIDSGRAEEAPGVYREVAGRTQGFYGQQALLSLAETQIDLGKPDDAKQTLAEYRTRFPVAPTERADALAAKAGGTPVGAPAAPVAPASELAPTTPTATPPSGGAG